MQSGTLETAGKTPTTTRRILRLHFLESTPTYFCSRIRWSVAVRGVAGYVIIGGMLTLIIEGKSNELARLAAISRHLTLYVLFLVLASLNMAHAQEVVIKPKEYSGALRNPLMGFVNRDFGQNERYDWGTLVKFNIKWNDIENNEADRIDKIRAYCDVHWKDAAAINVKIIPRVYLEWSTDNERYWPADLKPGDYSSEKFKHRLVRLISRLGQVWDNDPRVAFVQMGIVGKWGEHHSPNVSPELQKLMGDAFTAALPHKLVMVRHPWDFREFRFGIHWDSFAHVQQDYHADGIMKLGDRWQTAVMGGETAYDWGRFKEQPGDNPSDTLSNPTHRDYVINLIRQLHCNHLAWISDYDRKNQAARDGAEEVQKAFGYRFILDEVRYPSTLYPGTSFKITFSVRNTGSTPFYYRWPVQACLLDATTKKPVWKANFQNLDLRRWLPGDFWLSATQNYAVSPVVNRVDGHFKAPQDLPKGSYILALAICDPAGNLPSARFATSNYFKGGYHPIGYIGIGVKITKAEIEPSIFDDPLVDRTLHYIAH